MTLRFRLMSRLGLAEPLVRWYRNVERAGRQTATTPARDRPLVARTDARSALFRATES